jgi:hypothetical protein
VRWRPVTLSAVTLSACVLAGCGSSGHKTSPAAGDIDALQRAVAGGRSSEALVAVGALLGEAQSLPGDREGWKGTALLRERLPAIVARFRTEYPRARRRLERIRVRTDVGARLKALLLRRSVAQRRQILRLQAAVATGAYAWGTVLRWLDQVQRESALYDRRLRAILAATTAA